ncbi:MAG: Mur ligase family protein [bacterium]|nr:Mur ligase family protein [bacterium]
MTRQEAEDYIYESYLKAQQFHTYNTKDCDKRNPLCSRAIIQSMAGTPAVVVTGSKGKGSVCSMIASVLGTQLHVGIMTSPHIEAFNERFRFDGQMISDADFVRQAEAVRLDFDAVARTLVPGACISPMGIQAAMALRYFREMGSDFNVFECGKGAAYDDVNNVVHDYAVINTIFLEHTRELGETLEQIAADKAHVITGEQKCVFVGPQKPEVLAVLKARAEEMNVPLRVYGKDFRAEDVQYSTDGMTFTVVIGERQLTNLSLPLLGEHQAKNAALALALCMEVLGNPNEQLIRKSLSKICWRGRLELLAKNPVVLLDACINRASCEPVIEVLHQMKLEKLCVVIGIPKDKDYLGVAQQMACYAGKLILTKSQNPHYCFDEEQVKKLNEKLIKAEWAPDVEAAIRLSYATQLPILILGTTSVVAEVIHFFRTKMHGNEPESE